MKITKITHVIAGLSIGGAEMMLYKLLTAWDRKRCQFEVISLTDPGILGPRIEQLGVRVRALAMKRGAPSIQGFIRLAKWLRQSSPQLVQTWMYHADLIGGLAARLSVRAPVIWGVRNGIVEPRGNKRSTIWTAKACARLSGVVPDRIVCNSENARRFHTKMGYHREKFVVIPNGFDLTAFRPDPEARVSLRSELGLSSDALLIGLVARFDPQKDHRNFIEAARLLLARAPDVHFALCGDGVDQANGELVSWVRAANLDDRFHLLGRRDDIPRITAALDVASCSSYAEAFPNVLGEAMACGVPCVATDAGDSAHIIADTGTVVPIGDANALAEGWLGLIQLGCRMREQLGRKARRRIEEEFDLRKIAACYEAHYAEITSRMN